MPVAFDAAASGNGNDVTTFSWSHTSTGANRVGVVGIAVRDDAADVTGVTWGGASMTFVRLDVIAAVVRLETWIIVAPATGAQTVEATMSVAADAAGGSMSFTGAAQAGQPTNNAGGTGVSTGPTATVTSAVDRMVAGFVMGERLNTDVQIAPGADQTQRFSQSGPTANRPRLEGTTEAGAASVVTSWTFTNSDDWAVAAIDIDTAAGAGTEQFMVAARELTSGGGMIGRDYI